MLLRDLVPFEKIDILEYPAFKDYLRLVLQDEIEIGIRLQRIIRGTRIIEISQDLRHPLVVKHGLADKVVITEAASQEAASGSGSIGVRSQN